MQMTLQYTWSTWWQCCTVFGTPGALGATQYQAAGDNAEDYEAAMWISRLFFNCEFVLSVCTVYCTCQLKHTADCDVEAQIIHNCLSL